MPNAAQKSAATKRSAAKKTAAQPQQTVLYRLPEGWDYTVSILGPDGTGVTLGRTAESGDALEMTVVTPDGQVRTQTVTDMSTGLKQASTAAKALDKVAQREAALADARNESLAFLDAPAAPTAKKAAPAKKTTAKKTAAKKAPAKKAAATPPADPPAAPGPVALDDVD